MNYDVIIIGAGMAGLTAGIYVCRAGKSALVLESGVIGGQIVPALRVDNWPGSFGVSGSDLMKSIVKQAEELGVEIKYEETLKITELGDGFTVVTEDSKYSCGAVIIATGTEPRKLSDKQAKDAGKRPISYCATCDGAFYVGQEAYIIIAINQL